MCGVFGGIKNIDYNIIKLLGVLNESRGTDASGLFDLKSYVKHDNTFRNLILNDDLELLLNFDSYVVGHTRLSTHGKNCKKNAHPFIHGKIIGVHNGIIRNFETLKYRYGQLDLECDSEILFYLLNEKGIEGLKEVVGYYTIIWADRTKPDKLFFLVHECMLSYYRDKKAGYMYFCSDGDDLETALDCGTDYQDALPNTLYEVDINTLRMTLTKIRGLQDDIIPSYSYTGVGYDVAYDENEFYRQDDKRWDEQQKKYKECHHMKPLENTYVTPAGIVSEKDGEKYQAVKNTKMKCPQCDEELSIDEVLKEYCGVCRCQLSGVIYQCYHCESLVMLDQIQEDNKCPICMMRMNLTNAYRIEQAEMEV